MQDLKDYQITQEKLLEFIQLWNKEDKPTRLASIQHFRSRLASCIERRSRANSYLAKYTEVEIMLMREEWIASTDKRETFNAILKKYPINKDTLKMLLGIDTNRRNK